MNVPKEKRSFCVHYETISATNLNANNSNEANFITMRPMHVSDHQLATASISQLRRHGELSNLREALIKSCLLYTTCGIDPGKR